MGSRCFYPHYIASQTRIETWSRLKKAALRLEARGEIHTDLSGLSSSIFACFEALIPIERYWAFPGADALTHLRELFEREEYGRFSNAVTELVHRLINDAYRDVSSGVDRIGGGVNVSASHHNAQQPAPCGRRHYFEVLFVDNLSHTEERELRRRVREMSRTDDQFAYDIVVVPSLEDALIAVMFNPNIQSVVVRADIPLKSKNRFKCSTLCIPGMEAADFEANSHRAPCTILGKVIRCLRPELDLYLIVDADGAETPAEAHDSFRRVFYSPEDDLELYLSIRQGVLERYQTPFFSALKAHSQRPTGVFHAMPLSRAIPCFNRIGFRI